jgi:hypothetical protein
VALFELLNITLVASGYMVTAPPPALSVTDGELDTYENPGLITTGLTIVDPTQEVEPATHPIKVAPANGNTW